MKATFKVARVRMAERKPVGIPGTGVHNAPHEKELWLIGEHRRNGTWKFYVSNRPADADIDTLISDVKERWCCEQGHQIMKEELGLDHFEGRSWKGFHRHCLMVMIVFLFLQSLQFKQNSETAGQTRRRG